MPDPKRPKSSRRTDLPVGPVPSKQESDRAPQGADEDVDRGSGRGRQEGVESVPREGEVGETGGRDEASHAGSGRQVKEISAPQAREVVDERQHIRETAHHRKT